MGTIQLGACHQGRSAAASIRFSNQPRQPGERRNMPGADARATVWHGVGDNEGAISPYGPGTAYVEKATVPNVICVAGRNNLPVPQDPSRCRSESSRFTVLSPICPVPS